MRKNSILWMVGFEPTSGDEVEYNKWHDQHATKLFECEDLKRASRYRCYDLVAGDSKEECAKYLAMYEFESKEAQEAFSHGYQFSVASEDINASCPDLGHILWSGLYEPQKILERDKLTDSVLFVVATDCDPKKKTEYNHYYSDIHLPELFECKGVKRASRYQCYKQMGKNKVESNRYLSFFEFDNKEGPATYLQSPAAVGARPDWNQKMLSLNIKLKWAASYEPIKSWER
jgi:hypothetical protein